jgi:hypothetical protein
VFLVAADLHLTDRPRDEHRFGLFKWMAKQQKRNKVTATFLLGDITDQKDRHSAALVNRIVDELMCLEPPVYILMGNHDYVNSKTPFFRFLNTIEGVHFVTEPCYLEHENVALIPHQPTQEAFDKACAIIPERAGVMTHQLFTGAIGETGSRLTGLVCPVIEAKRPRWVLAGDIHKPQQVGIVTYVGAPYSIRFGDEYEPRCLLVGKTFDSIQYNAPRKFTLRIQDPDEIKMDDRLYEGDQVKVILKIPRSKTVDWPFYRERTRELCDRLGLELHGVEMMTPDRMGDVEFVKAPTMTAEEAFDRWCKKEGITDRRFHLGKELL